MGCGSTSGKPPAEKRILEPFRWNPNDRSAVLMMPQAWTRDACGALVPLHFFMNRLPGFQDLAKGPKKSGGVHVTLIVQESCRRALCCVPVPRAEYVCRLRPATVRSGYLFGFVPAGLRKLFKHRHIFKLLLDFARGPHFVRHRCGQRLRYGRRRIGSVFGRSGEGRLPGCFPGNGVSTGQFTAAAGTSSGRTAVAMIRGRNSSFAKSTRIKVGDVAYFGRHAQHLVEVAIE